MNWYTFFGACCLTWMLLGCSSNSEESSATKTQRPLNSSSALSMNSQNSTVSSASSEVTSSSIVAISSTSSWPNSSDIEPSSSSISSSSEATTNNSSSLSSSSTSSDLYTRVIEPDVVQARCVTCHVSTGLSAHTRLVFTSGTSQAALNRTVFAGFASNVKDGAQLILDKVRGGAGHGGSVVFPSSSEEYQALAEFLTPYLQSGTGGGSNSSASAEITQKIELDNEEKTLRRAALLLAGRLPTEEETLAASSSENALRTQLRQMMQGEGFHNFLIRGANDRLLLDAFLNGQFLDVVDATAPQYPVLADLHVQANVQGGAALEEFNNWRRKFTYGIARAPLELIAYVVENDRPYTEILTADYTMVNPYSALIYNAMVPFVNDADVTEFVPAQNRGQILVDQYYDGEYVPDQGTIIYSHGDWVDYPHAGILNEPAFLSRYPTTDTNRNRARSRWTYYHFLGVDIEKSAGRTNDPEALADTNNPTMNNPNCTVCHQLMDPVAGAFQNYGPRGWYRDSWGGLDALPASYKWGEDSDYVHGDTWFRDMRAPGFSGEVITNTDQSLQWLAGRLVDDERFAHAAVKFWWPAIMSEPLREAPESSEDQDYQAQMMAFETQQELVEELAIGFRQGFAGGQAYNLKDLLVEMVLSHWFRANGALEHLSEQEKVQLASVGKGRLLTPEELEAKTRSILGLAWGERSDAGWIADGYWSMLNNSFRIYYGGIDSRGITERAAALNSLMSNVALGHALALACPSVVLDFNREGDERRLFNFVDRYTIPTQQAREQVGVNGTEQTLQTQLHLNAGPQTLRISFDNPFWDSVNQQSLILLVHSVTVRDANNAVIVDYQGKDFADIPGVEISTNQKGNNSGGRYWDTEAGGFTGWQMWEGYVGIPLSVPVTGPVTIDISASRLNITSQTAFMSTSSHVSLNQPSSGQTAIRQQLQFFHEKLLGETLALDDPELDASYQLLLELWQERQNRGFPRNAVAWNEETCEIPVDNWWQEDRTRELADPEFMQGTWMSMLIYFLTDYFYLHE